MKLKELTKKLLEQAGANNTVISAQIILSTGSKIEMCTYDNGWGKVLKEKIQ